MALHSAVLVSVTGPPAETPLFVAIAEFCLARGFKGLSKVPGCCEVQVDDRWFFAVNGHAEPTTCAKTGQPIPPFSAYVEFNGWPAGLLDPAGGIICAGELANEDTFRAALHQAGPA